MPSAARGAGGTAMHEAAPSPQPAGWPARRVLPGGARGSPEGATRGGERRRPSARRDARSAGGPGERGVLSSSAGATTAPGPSTTAGGSGSAQPAGAGRQEKGTTQGRYCQIKALFGCIRIYLGVFGFIWVYSDLFVPRGCSRGSVLLSPVQATAAPQPRPGPAALRDTRPGHRRRGAPSAAASRRCGASCPEQPWRPGRLTAPLPTFKMAARGLARRRRLSAVATASLPLIGCAR